jgi:integrase
VSNAELLFAGPTGKPPRPDMILAHDWKPAAAKAGTGKLGWHSFRHTHSSTLNSLGTWPAVQEELFRCADMQATLNIYTQAILDEKRGDAATVRRHLGTSGMPCL